MLQNFPGKKYISFCTETKVEKNYQVSVNEFAFVIDPSHDQGQVPIQFSSFRLTDVHVLRTK